jgi:hypothetical protein
MSVSHFPQNVADTPQFAPIRARIRRSLDDPRPDVTLAEVDAHLAAHFTRAAGWQPTAVCLRFPETQSSIIPQAARSLRRYVERASLAACHHHLK